MGFGCEPKGCEQIISWVHLKILLKKNIVAKQILFEPSLTSGWQGNQGHKLAEFFEFSRKLGCPRKLGSMGYKL